MKIKMINIEQLPGFNPKEFNARTLSYDAFYVREDFELPEGFVEQAKQKAKEVDGICIAVLQEDSGKQYALSNRVANSYRFVFFNAESVEKDEGEVRAIVFNTGLGALTRYWYDQYLRCAPGSIV